MRYIGIDPGASGAIASIEQTHAVTYPFRGKLESALDYARFLKGIPELSDPAQVNGIVLERVGGYVAGNPTPGGAMFSFGRGFGILEALLVAAFGSCVRLVTPATWQSGLGIEKRRKTESASDWKRRLKAEASALFPSQKVTLGTADALLLAEYCRRLVLWGEDSCRRSNRKRR